MRTSQRPRIARVLRILLWDMVCSASSPCTGKTLWPCKSTCSPVPAVPLKPSAACASAERLALQQRLRSCSQIKHHNPSVMRTCQAPCAGHRAPAGCRSSTKWATPLCHPSPTADAQMPLASSRPACTPPCLGFRWMSQQCRTSPKLSDILLQCMCTPPVSCCLRRPMKSMKQEAQVPPSADSENENTGMHRRRLHCLQLREKDCNLSKCITIAAAHFTLEACRVGWLLIVSTGQGTSMT